MNQDLSTLSAEELEIVIANAQKTLAERQRAERKDVITKIHALAGSIGLSVTIHEGAQTSRTSSRKGSKAPIKFRNPQDPTQVWTGRGVTPRWLKSLLDLGHSLESFRL